MRAKYWSELGLVRLRTHVVISKVNWINSEYATSKWREEKSRMLKNNQSKGRRDVREKRNKRGRIVVERKMAD